MFLWLKKKIISFTLPFLVLWGLPFTVQSQAPEVWTNLGLYGGQIYDIAIDPANPDEMFAGSFKGDGLYVSIDGGSTWQAVLASENVRGEDSFKNHAVWAVKIAPSDRNVIWASHNYWVEKSTDGGQTWTHIWNGWMQSPNYDTCSNCPKWDQFRWCRSLAIDPSDPQTVYVGTSGRYSNYNPCGAIYRTKDGGLTWTKMSGPVDSCWEEASGDFNYAVVDLAIDDSDPDIVVIWAVTGYSGEGSLYRGEIDRVTATETWTEVFSMPGGAFHDVEVKPNDPDSIFTANDWGIFRHYFQAGEWKYQWILNLSQEPPPAGAVFARNVRALAFDPKNPDILYAAWKNSTSQWPDIDTSSKVAKGTPPYEDANWEIYSVDYQFLSLAVHPENSEILLGGELTRGIYKSLDHGQNWVSINLGINSLLVNDIDLDPNDPNHLLAATSAGVYEKRGAGDWTNTSDFEYSHVFSVTFDATDTDGSTYYAGAEARLAKTTDSGTTWSLSDAIPDNFVSDVAVGSNGSNVFITTVKPGSGTAGVYKNDNGLATPTLTQVLSSEKFDFNVVTIDPNDSEHIFAGSGSYSGTNVPGNLYESTTGGDAGTWKTKGLIDVTVNALLIDPRDSNIMYAGCGYSGGTLVPVYKSTDGGANWIPFYEGIPGLVWWGRGIWGTSPTNVFAVGDGGIIRNYDGSTWAKIEHGVMEQLYEIWGNSEDHIFTVGDGGTILHYDGNTWSAMSSGSTASLYGVWGGSKDDVFAVGANGTTLHYDGSAWSAMISGSTEHLRDIWGSHHDNVFAVGFNGTILNYNSGIWTTLSAGTTEHLRGIWGASAINIFVVGSSGTILHFDGHFWTSMDSGTTTDLEGVWGASATDVFAVGDDGMILHYDGSTWTVMDSGTTEYMWSAWGTSGTDVFAIGGEGSVLHYDGSNWTFSRPRGKNWNSVTDLKFHPGNKDVIYAGTTSQGIYLSPNQGVNWLNLGIPEYDVNAVSAGSLFAATEGGLFQCIGTGVIAGKVVHAESQRGIDGARIFTDSGVRTRSVYGEYMMVCPSGIHSVVAIADGYANQTLENEVVLGADVSWLDIAMKSGVTGQSINIDTNNNSSSAGGNYCFISAAAF
jgi:hypothetical protein